MTREQTMNVIDQRELVPLEGGLRKSFPAVHSSRRYTRETSYRAGSCVKGPLRALRLLLLIALIPALFVSIPLYLRYHVFSGQLYPMSMSDMRLIDGKISTTWCQRQVLKSNATFNAFLVSRYPEIARQLVPVSMTRHLLLDDDMKEYWGFYLLKGSIVTVSTCVRWPGASLIMIRGHKHLQECAYIGDNSSEEIEEVLEAFQRGLFGNRTLEEILHSLGPKKESPTNDPESMKRHHSDVTFHDPAQAESRARAGAGGGAAQGKAMDARGKGKEGVDDSKDLKEILETIHAQENKVKMEKRTDRPYQKPGNIKSVPELTNRHRETNVDRNEEHFLSFKGIENEKKSSGDKEVTVQMSDRRLKNSKSNISPNEDVLAKESKMVTVVNPEPVRQNETFADTAVNKNEKQSKSEETEKTLSSMEIYEDVLEKLTSLGDKGKGVLDKLNQKMSSDNSSQEIPHSTPEPKLGLDEMERLADEKIEALKKILQEVIREHEHKKESRDARRSANAAARDKRDLYISHVATDLKKEFNTDDAEQDNAKEEEDEDEEGLQQDGYADDHRRINETTLNDMSNSEFWSSFSSSEEALLQCEGLILNLPLTPHTKCAADKTDQDHHNAALSNAVTYRVPANGYYFFVFNSENEVQTNFIRVRFDLQKTIYDLTTENKIMECKNSTDKCTLPLDIFSNEKVVLEVPLSANDSLWNEDFVVISECEPRTSVYLVCVIAVPLLIIIFAFQ